MNPEEKAKRFAVRSPSAPKTAEDFLRWRREQIALQENSEEQHTQSTDETMPD